MFIILFSSCSSSMPGGVTQLFAGRRGYHRVGTEDRGPGRGRDPEAENRLIDNLDEEWED
jgi:cation-dependent mannose-6-phosphate receptor